jgi:beta-glucosidase
MVCILAMIGMFGLLMAVNASSLEVLLGNYYGSSSRLVSILEGVTARVPDAMTLRYKAAIQLDRDNLTPCNWSAGDAAETDAVIAVMGLAPMLEGEEGDAVASPYAGDRENIGLPTCQIEMLRKFHARGTKIVLVLTGGSALAIPDVHDLVDAIIYVWYPGEEGGSAVADILFGDTNPSGRLPVTFPKSVADLPDFEDYSMANRTYRYSKAEPLYPFGFGLSYSRFEYGPVKLSKATVAAGESVAATVRVKNVGQRKGEEVVQFYLTDDEASVRVPRWAMKGFQRVRLAPGKSANVKFQVTPEQMALIDEQGQERLEPGTFTVTISGCSPDPRNQQLGASRPSAAKFEAR